MERMSPARASTVLIFLAAAALVCATINGCDHGLEPVGSGSQGQTGLHGRVTLLGEWPSDTAIVAAALFREKPTSADDYSLEYFTQAPPDSSWFDYEWNFTAADSFGYLVVSWLREGDSMLDPNAWIELGFYADTVSPDKPGKIVVMEGEFLRIDLTGDFSKVPPPVQSADGFDR